MTHSQKTGAATLIATHAIRNTLAIHSRGVDRADGNLLASAYHPDATVDYGFYAGPATTLVDILAAAQKSARPTLHRTSNIEIRVDGNRAHAESYVIAYVEEADIYRMVCGRYLDRLTLRDGQWRLTHRTYVMDANTNRPSNATRPDPAVAPGQFAPAGGHGAADAARSLLAQYHAQSLAQHKAAPDMPMPQTTPDNALEDALSREAIRRLLTAYARAADRADGDLMASVFWDDATVISGVINGPAPDFAAGIVDIIKTHMDGCFHSIANEWIEIAGAHGVGEHYVLALARTGGNDIWTGGRYVDRYERRAGVWKIASRVFVCDWTQSGPSTNEDAGFYEALKNRGAFGKGDPVYAHWAELEAVA